MWEPWSFYYEFLRECDGGENNKISNVKSFYHFAIGKARKARSLKITMLIFLVKNGKMKLSRESIFSVRRREKLQVKSRTRV